MSIEKELPDDTRHTVEFVRAHEARGLRPSLPYALGAVVLTFGLRG